MKINVDAAIEDTHGAIGVIVRNHNGYAIYWMARKSNFFDPQILEAEALFEACTWARREVTVSSICSDAKVVVEAVLQKGPMIWRAQAFILECQKLLGDFSLSILFSPRSSNVAAHLLARWALISVLEQICKDILGMQCGGSHIACNVSKDLVAQRTQ